MGLFDGIFKRKDKPAGKPDFSGVQGGGSSTAPTTTPVATPIGGSRAGRTYTVVQGDSLSKIAKQFYGDANKWRTIYEANRDTIKDPDLIYPGQSFRIPEA